MSEPLLKRRYTEMEEEDEDEEGIRTDYGSAVYHYPPHLQHGNFTSLEKLMFFTSSLLLILLFIFVGLYARSSQSDEPIIPLPTSLPTIHTCHSSQCIMTAAGILNDIDPHLDPCDDFYAFTCRQWQDDHPLPEALSRIDTVTLTQQRIHRRLDQLLTRGYQKQPSPLPRQDDVLDEQLFTKISDFYASCMDQDQIEAVGVRPLFTLFRTIQDLIPLDRPVSPPLLQQVVRYLADRGVDTLFMLSPRDNTLYLSPVKKKVEAYEPTAYFQTMITMLDLVFSKDTHNEFGFKYWSTTATARRILAFEEEVFMHNSVGSEETWTLEALCEALPMFDWRAYVDEHMGNLPLPTHVVVPSTAFIDHLRRNVLIDNQRTLQMYFLWRTLWKYVDVLGDEFVGPKRQLEAVTKGIEPRARLDRRDVCMQILNESPMGLLLGRYYVLDQQKEINEDQFKTWLDESIQLLKTKIKSSEWNKDDSLIQSLDTLEFDTNSNDLMPVVSLADYFGDVMIQKDDFFGNIERNQLHAARHMWQSTRPFSLIQPQSVNIQYQPENNKMIIPIGLLQFPFYQDDGPMYVSIASIGQIIGHHMMHHVYVNGNLSDTMKEVIETQRQCLIDQYSAYGVNGEMSVDHDYADQLVWIELLDNKEKMATLPGLEAWNRDQLAYIQYARLFCSQSTQAQELLRRDISPDHLRVNLPLLNSNRFSKVFSCKKGNSSKKCNIWK